MTVARVESAIQHGELWSGDIGQTWTKLGRQIEVYTIQMKN